MNLPLTPVRFLRYAEQQFPRKAAVVCQDQRFTYAEFGDRVGRLAGALRAVGLKAGDRVAFLSLNCHRLLEAYYGVLEAGCILLPLNIRLTGQSLVTFLIIPERRRSSWNKSSPVWWIPSGRIYARRARSISWMGRRKRSGFPVIPTSKC